MTLQPCAKGTVVRITVDNFTTFACKRTFHPSPGLNILCGPNGSGKSSIVSAICLGLGFPEKVIDNKKKAADYISKGSSFCEIEIQLSDGGMRRSTFSRKFFSSKTSKDVFKINGERVASRNAYLARVRDEYKIRLENATQYLPQSKLEKFKRLSPKDRLTATLEAVAPEMLQERETIEKADEYKAEREKALATSKTLADQAKKDLEKANKDAAGIREKLESNDTLHLLHLGILAKERQELRARVTEHKAATKNIKEKFRAAKAAVDVAVEAEAAAQASIAEQRKAANVTAKDLYKCSRLVKNRADDTHKSLQHITSAKQEVDDIKDDLHEARERLADLTQTLEGEKNILKKLVREHGSKEELAQTCKTLRQKAVASYEEQGKWKDLQDQMESNVGAAQERASSVRKQLTEMQNVESREGKFVLHHARRGQSGDNRKLVELRRHLQRSTGGRVFGPIAIDVWATEKRFAPVVSNIVYCKQGFVATNQRDYDQLYNELKNRSLHKMFGVKVYKITDESVRAGKSDKSPFPVTQELKDLGVLCWATDIIRATNSHVLEAVKLTSSMHMHLVGESKCGNSANLEKIRLILQKLMKQPGQINLHILPPSAMDRPKVWSLSKSRYDADYYRAWFTPPARVETGDVLLFHPPDEEREKKLDQLKAKLEALKQEEADLIEQAKEYRRKAAIAQEETKVMENEVRPLEKLKSQWVSAERKVQKQQKKVDAAENKVEELEATLDERRKEAEEAVKEAQDKFLDYFGAQVAASQGKIVAVDVDYCLRGLKAAHATRRIAELTVAADTANEELQNYEREYNEAKQYLAELEEAINDRKFDVFVHESALWVCDLAPKPNEGDDRYARKSFQVLCNCPRPDGAQVAHEKRKKKKKKKKSDEEYFKCQRKVGSFLLDDIRTKQLRFRIRGEYKMQSITDASLEECRHLLRTKQESLSNGLNRAELREQLAVCEKKIEDLTIQHRDLVHDATRGQEELAEEFANHVQKKKAWLQKIRHIVEKLHDKFNKLMKQIGNVGKWELGNLAEPDEDTKLMDLTMQLTATFAAREDGSEGDLLHMQRLSGGENAVTTCVALMAVQQMYPAPFRIADEVNQGMDEINRWLTLQLLTERPRLASPDDGKQFFILTPKLLRQISYERDDVQAMVLVNGPDVAWDGMQSPSIAKLIEYRQQVGGGGGGATSSAGRPAKRKVSSSGGRAARPRFDDSDSD